MIDKGLRFYDDQGKTHDLKKSDFRRMIDSDGEEFKVCLKLTEQHINAKGQTRQQVRLAAQLLSHTVGKGVHQILGETFACQSDAILTVKNFVLEFWPEYFTQALFSLLRKLKQTAQHIC